MRIGIDLDGVMCDFFTPCNRWLASYLGSNPAPGNIWTWYEEYGPAGGVAWREFWKMVEADPEWWLGLEPLPGAVDAVFSLVEAGHEVVFVTNRNAKYEAATREWVSARVGAGFQVYFVRGDKSQVDCDLYVDDSPIVLEALAKAGKPAIRMVRAYNEDAPAEGDVTSMRFLPDAINCRSWRTDTYRYTSGEVRVTDPDTGGQKGTKLERFDLIPAGPERLLARHYGIGARKYEDRNWEKGYPWSLSIAALRRHLNAFQAGEWLDPDADEPTPHLAAVVFHAFALMEFHETHPEKDDRSGPRSPSTE